jgi:hypothetical protein
MHWLCFALYGGQGRGAAPAPPALTCLTGLPVVTLTCGAERCKLLCQRQPELGPSMALKLGKWQALQAPSCTALLCGTNHNIPSASHAVGKDCQRYGLSQIHRSSLRCTATSAVGPEVDGGWPRALDFVKPSCCCRGSLTASAQPSLLLSRCMVAYIVVHCECLHFLE